LQSLLACSVGNPRQAIIGVPWPWEVVSPEVLKWIQLGVDSQIAPSGVSITRALIDFVDEAAAPFIGTLILRNPRHASESLDFIKPLLGKCGIRTDLIICGDKEDKTLFEVVKNAINSESKIEVFQTPESTQKSLFFLSRPPADHDAGFFSVVRSPDPIKERNDSFPELEILDLSKDQPQLQHNHSVWCGAGVRYSEVVKRFDYLSGLSRQAPAACYTLIKNGYVDSAGRVFDKSGKNLSEILPPYLRSTGTLERRVAAEEILPGRWIFIASGGLSHTHWLVEGFLRLWPAYRSADVVGVISPRRLLHYQREMVELALGSELPILELEEAKNLFQVEELLLWNFCIGHSPDVRSMLDGMRGENSFSRQRRLFVRRSDRPLYRNCLNEDDVAEVARNYGFTVVDPSRLSGSDEVKIFSEAEIVVGAIGGGLNNVIFSRPGTKVIGYTAKSYLEPHLIDFSSIGKLDLSILFCEQIDAPDLDLSCELRGSSFFVDIKAVERLISAATEKKNKARAIEYFIDRLITPDETGGHRL
jgi:hypothetical protein